MNILILSAEVAPLAKVGGLADVAASLPIALRDSGHDARLVMPGYAMALHQADFPATKIRDFRVEMCSGWSEWVALYEIDLHGVPVYLIGCDKYFGKATESAKVYTEGYDQYLFFAKAALALSAELEWPIDVVHANDWHTAFAPVFMREHDALEWDHVASIFTIHNLAYQGEFGIDVLDRAGLPRSLYNMHQLETYGSVNFLKGGCVYADQVNTVSPSYAREIQTSEYGCRLEGLMKHLDAYGRLHGILNGIDTEEWNPATDPHLHNHFSASDPSGKAACKQELAAELGLDVSDETPLMGVVSRLSSQKGMDLLLNVADRLIAAGGRLIVQGLGDAWLAEQFRELAQRHPRHFAFAERFDAALAQRVYAGCDLFLMPSAFEPCGLGQMIALRYGTVPVVRQTGGLADTVFEGVNGFVFEERSSEPFWQALQRAFAAFADPEQWSNLRQGALEGDYGWERSAAEYVKLFEAAIAHRQLPDRLGVPSRSVGSPVPLAEA